MSLPGPRLPQSSLEGELMTDLASDAQSGDWGHVGNRGPSSRLHEGTRPGPTYWVTLIRGPGSSAWMCPLPPACSPPRLWPVRSASQAAPPVSPAASLSSAGNSNKEGHRSPQAHSLGGRVQRRGKRCLSHRPDTEPSAERRGPCRPASTDAQWSSTWHPSPMSPSPGPPCP